MPQYIDAPHNRRDVVLSHDLAAIWSSIAGPCNIKRDKDRSVLPTQLDQILVSALDDLWPVNALG